MAFIIDGSTGIATVDGSVSAPSQRGQDLNSGISYAADTIKFSTNGVERMAITNSGVSGITAGITVADCWHVTSSFTNPNQNGGFIAADWSRATYGQLGNIGAAINQYGRTFSFNQTGIYLIDATVGCHITSGGVDRYIQASLLYGTGGHNGSFLGNPTTHYTNLGAGTSTTHGFVRTSMIMDVTNTGAANTSVDCFRLYTSSSNTSTIIKGSSTGLTTYFTVLRLGDT